MKFFEASQIKIIDNYTIDNEPIGSFLLMERASCAFTDKVLPLIKTGEPVSVFAGPGNNGGDAFVVARFLALAGITVHVFLVNRSGGSLSADCKKAKEKFCLAFPGRLTEINSVEMITEPLTGYVVDGLFGTGLSRPLEGVFAEVVALINNSRATVFSIDIPSGLLGEDNRQNRKEAIVRADYTFSFQFPKLSFFLPENEEFIGEFSILDINLHPQVLHDLPSPYYFMEEEDVKRMAQPRRKFSHKGDYGHALLVAGSYGKVGAAVLAAKACLRAGCGLLSVHVPLEGIEIVQISVPEAMVEPEILSKTASFLKRYNAVGIGPGMGVDEEAEEMVSYLLKHSEAPLVLDADALNIIAQAPELFQEMPPETIITPHPKEFDRLAGASSSGYERLQKQLNFAEQHRVIVVLKGAHTSIAFPDGRCFFNSTGNPGMATAGSGNVLTGIILSLLAQKYKPEDAALFGVYLHGLAGDIAAGEFSQQSMLAGDIIQFLGKAFNRILGQKNI